MFSPDNPIGELQVHAILNRHKTAEEILDRLAGYCTAINKSQGASA